MSNFGSLLAIGRLLAWSQPRRVTFTRIVYGCTLLVGIGSAAQIASAQPFYNGIQTPVTEATNLLDKALVASNPLQSPDIANANSTRENSPQASLTSVLNYENPALRQRERFAYQAAKTALKNKQYQKAQGQLAALNNYPLKPYIEYELIAANISKLPFDEIDSFLAQYTDSLLADKLTGATLYFLTERQQWQQFNHYYTVGFKSTQMRCRSLYARYKTGDALALDEAIELWNIGASAPDACDALFRALNINGKLTPDLLWSRFDKAIHNNKIALAKYIQRSMPTADQPFASLYLQVYANPSLVTQQNKFRVQSTKIQSIIAFGIAKLARKDAQLAWTHWEKYEAQALFDASLVTETKRQIVKYLTRDGRLAEAEQILSYSHSLRETSLVENLIRENLELQNWSAVAANIPLLNDEEQNSDRWRYWYARSHEILGTANIDTQAIYTELAKGRSWYGFLSADHLSTSYQLEDASSPADGQIKTSLAVNPAMQRAKELWIIGEHTQARAEWYYALKGLSTSELLAAGELAKDWGWYNSGITAMISGNLWDHLTLRFPLAYNDEIAQAAANSQLDQTLIYAIARQESAFASDAVSHVGARGLMQLMPATAKEQARFSGVKNYQTKDLMTPEHNIKLGSAYLGNLLKEFNGNRILATAAYNAGEHRVKRWLQTPRAETPADIWIETIPFKETRHYVQNVLTYSVIYDYRIEMNASRNGKKRDIKGSLLRDNEAKITL